jgi:hypothetical protein
MTSLIRYYWGDEIKENAGLGIWHVWGEQKYLQGLVGEI